MSLFISPELANIPRVPRISQALGDFKPAPLILLYLLTQKSFAILISRVNLMGFWRKTAFSSSHKHSTRLSFDDDVDFTSQTCHQLTCSFWGHKRPSQFPPWTEGPPSCLQVTSATGRAGGNELCCSSLQREKRGLSNSTKFTADSPHQGLPFSPYQPCRHIFQLHLCSCQPLPASCQAPISTFIYYPCRLVRKQNSPPPKSHVQFSSVAQLCPSLSDPWTVACQAFLSIINSRSLLKLKSIELVIPPNHLILCCPLLLSPSKKEPYYPHGNLRSLEIYNYPFCCCCC